MQNGTQGHREWFAVTAELTGLKVHIDPSVAALYSNIRFIFPLHMEDPLFKQRKLSALTDVLGAGRLSAYFPARSSSERVMRLADIPDPLILEIQVAKQMKRLHIFVEVFAETSVPAQSIQSVVALGEIVDESVAGKLTFSGNLVYGGKAIGSITGATRVFSK